MFQRMIKKSAQLGAFLFFLIAITSCEKDFKDIGLGVINNSKFNVKDTILEVLVTNKSIDVVRADGLALGGSPYHGSLGQYLLGVYENTNYENITASIVSQIGVKTNLKVVDDSYVSDTIAITTIDAIYLNLPYQSTLDSINDDTPHYTLDSIIGNRENAFAVNVYELNTYLNNLNPNNPAQQNQFASDATYNTVGTHLNETFNFEFIPNRNDTVFYMPRTLSTGELYTTDTITYFTSTTSKVPAPVMRIPLNKTKLKELFMDKYEDAEFDSQAAFNDYFRGIVIEASGADASLVSFNFNATLKPAIEFFYTNTIIAAGQVIDTLKKNDTFLLSGIKTNTYQMEINTPAVDEIKIQGAAGTMAETQILLGTQLEELRSRNWLINQASLTFYIDQDKDSSVVPYRLFLYKNGVDELGNSNPSQLKDILTEGAYLFDGKLTLSDGVPNSYRFRITDYISDLLSGESNYNPPLGLKVYNPTDTPEARLDTVVGTYNWNPKAITLKNHSAANGDRRARLKISYTVQE